MEFNPIFNIKLGIARNMTVLQSLVGNTAQNWTNKQRGIAMERAHIFVQDIADAIELAGFCASTELRCEILTTFARKFGIKTLGTAYALLLVLISSDQQKRSEKAVDEIISVAEDAGLLVIPKDVELEDLKRLARIAGWMSHYSEKQLVLEGKIIEVAFPFFRDTEKLVKFIDSAFITVTGRCAMIDKYVAEGTLYTITGASLLLNYLNYLLNIYETSMVLDDVSVDAIASTRTAIHEVIIELLKKNEHKRSYLELCDVAGEIRDPSNDGTASMAIEDAVIAAMIGRIRSAKETAHCAKSFFTHTGAHRFLIQYLGGFKEALIQSDLKLLVGAVRSRDFEGSKALSVIADVAKMSGLNIDVHELFEEQCSQIDSMQSFFERLLGGGGVVQVVVMGGQKNECLCPDCQINRIIEKDVAKVYLRERWLTAEEKLCQVGVLIKEDSGALFLPGSRADLEDAMKSFGVDLEMREILRKAFSKEALQEPAHKIDEMSTHLQSAAMRPEELRKALQKRLDTGELESAMLATPFGLLTIEQTIEQCAEILLPGYLEVLQEFADKLE